MSRILALLVAATVLSVPATLAPADAAGRHAHTHTTHQSGRTAAWSNDQSHLGWSAKAKPRPKAPDNFSPKPGVTFNNPVGGKAQQRAIFTRIMRSINSTPRGGDINIFSWNFLTRNGADALINAQKRGIKVRLLMDRGNNTSFVNQPFRRLQATLKQGNAKWPKNRHSYAKTCNHSCRGTTGSAHAKFFMFSQVGDVPRVVIQGSANFTVASTTNQWNDTYTHVRRQDVWDYYTKVFDQAAQDKKAPKPYYRRDFDGFSLAMFPLTRNPDPVMQLLDKVTCTGATNTASHRTRIRITPDVIRNDRGMRLAHKVRSLWNQGCDIRIGYTVVGIDIGRYLRQSGGRGPVPMRHLVQDKNGDGEFDNYFHLKAMSIVGHLGKNRGGYVTINGSANWSGLSSVSDENLGIYWSKKITQRYQADQDYWYNRFPSSSYARTSYATSLTRVPSPDQLLFGTGKHAVYEDGTPYSTSGINPYATMGADN